MANQQHECCGAVCLMLGLLGQEASSASLPAMGSAPGLWGGGAGSIVGKVNDFCRWACPQQACVASFHPIFVCYPADGPFWCTTRLVQTNHLQATHTHTMLDFESQVHQTTESLVHIWDSDDHSMEQLAHVLAIFISSKPAALLHQINALCHKVHNICLIVLIVLV